MNDTAKINSYLPFRNIIYFVHLHNEILSLGRTVSIRSTMSLNSSEYCRGIGLNSPLTTRLYKLAMSLA